MTDPQLLAALAEAVRRDPSALAVRLHLAQLLLESGAEAGALEHFAAVLEREPANLPALEGAMKAALASGDSGRAAGYGQLLAALRGAPSAPVQGATGEAASSPEAGRLSVQPSEPQSPPEGPGDRAGGERERVPAGGDGRPEWWDDEFPTVKLSDVGGMEAVKRRLNLAFLGPMRNPELMRAYGKSLRGGLLLYGPPGCGKTFIARATAGELGARFVSVGLDDVLSMWLGESERHLHELFETARRSAPCVLFFDELDAIGQKRSQARFSAGRNVVNQLLAELDGVDSSNEGLFVLGATNHPWDVDPALLRPGRFDRLALVTPPDQPAREAILRHHFRDKPVGRVDFGALAKRTEDFSGADLAHLADSSVETAMEESLAGGAVRAIETRDIEAALKEIRPSTRSWFDTARNFVLFANDGGTYDDLQDYMRARRLL